MPRKPRPTGKEMLAFLNKEGWMLVHIRGSHHILEKGTLRTSIPVHNNQELRIGTLFGILDDMKMSQKEFIAIFRRQ